MRQPAIKKNQRLTDAEREPDAPWGRKQDGTPRKRPGKVPKYTPEERRQRNLDGLKTPHARQKNKDYIAKRMADDPVWAAQRRARNNESGKRWYHENKQRPEIKEVRDFHNNKRVVAIKADPEKRKYENQKRSRWGKNNPEKSNAFSALAKANRKKACPKWADRKSIQWFYSESIRITAATGIDHEVDHIVPIKGRNVSGLHVSWNLRIIPMRENCSKNNKLIEELALAPTIANGLLKRQP